MGLAKRSIHVYGVDAQGRTCVDRKMRPGQVEEFLSRQAPCIIGLEACGRAHQWGRDIQALGHEARRMAPQFVKPCVKSNKNGRADAQAICEALQRPGMRFVGIKRAGHQAQQSIHRVRSRVVGHRTAQVNELRERITEYQCPICEAPLSTRIDAPTDPEQKHWDVVETCECGLRTFGGILQHPCPSDPKFPSLNDCDLVCEPHSKQPGYEWCCDARPKTDMARKVQLDRGYGKSEDHARYKVRANYLYRIGQMTNQEYVQVQLGATPPPS